jgi:glutaredoxin
MATPSLHAVRLNRLDLPDHPSPWGLRVVKLLQERHIPFEDHRLTSSEAVDTFKAAQGVATTPQIFAGPERIGGYTELAARLGVRPETADISYPPVVAVFGTAVLMALALSAGVRGLMGISICLLAAGRRSSLGPAAGQQQGQPGGDHHQGEHAEQQRVVGLQVDGAELAGVDLEQPEGIDAALQQQAVEGATGRRQQQRRGGQGNHDAMDAAETGAEGSRYRFHSCLSSLCSMASPLQGIQSPLFWWVPLQPSSLARCSASAWVL